MRKYVSLSILISISLFGCASFSNKVFIDNNIVLNQKTISKINGIYEIKSFKSVRRYENLKPDFVENDSLGKFLSYFTIKTNEENRNNQNANFENYGMQIQVLNSNKISIELLKENSSLEKLTLDYKVKKDGYLYLKNKNLKTKWIPGLCGTFEVNRTRISLDRENDLILNHSHYINGAILFVIGDSKKTCFGSGHKRWVFRSDRATHFG